MKKKVYHVDASRIWGYLEALRKIVIPYYESRDFK